jgi:hypothetical protein
MVTPSHDIMLDKLIESGYAKNIWLEYDSNCSAINNKIVERWHHFKRVDIRASADAIKEQYEVIRFGGKWEKFVTNIRKLRQIQTESNKKIRLLSVSTCFQIATAMSIVETEEWCKEEGVAFHMRFLTGPDWHAVSSLSDQAKIKLRDFYLQFVDTSTKAPLIVKYLNNQLGKGKPESVKEFKKFMDFLDTTRGTDWKKTFPLILELLD